MKLHIGQDTTLYGHAAEEHYKFHFSEKDKSLKTIEMWVKMDASGNGFKNKTAIEKKEIPVSEVPPDIREEAAEILMSTAGEV